MAGSCSPSTHKYEVLAQLHKSQSSVVELVSWAGPMSQKAVLKRRLSEGDFEMEVGFHQAMEACSSLFPRLLYYDIQERILVLEYAHRGSLESMLKSQVVPWEPKKVYNFLVQLLVCLNTLHRLNIVHGDIQPYHILLGDDLSPKLTGFHKSRYVRGINSNDLAFTQDICNLGNTMAGLICGSLGLCNQEDMKQYYLQFPDTFEEAMIAMLASSIGKVKSAVELISVLTDHSRIEASFANGVRQGQDESWLGSETLHSLAELRLEQSLSHVTSQHEEKPSMSIAGLSAIRSFRSKIANDSQQFSVTSDREMFIIGKTIGEITTRAHEKPFPELELVGLTTVLTKTQASTRGQFNVSLQPKALFCSGSCQVNLLTKPYVELKCGHNQCLQCISSLLSKAVASNTVYSRITCPTCTTPISPLNESISRLLPSALVTRLTDLYLFENVKSCPNPKCGFQFEAEDYGYPREIQCPQCKKSVCSYCFRKSHYFSCNKFNHDRRSPLK